MPDKHKLRFRPRARIIKIIGQELISDDVIALIELIKNSFDADADHVTIELNSIFLEDGEIIIEDDGIGMSYEKILSVWLEPATPDKKRRPGDAMTYSPKYGRRYLGEKGIGRFAAHRLGDKIELISRSYKSIVKDEPLVLNDYESRVEINWSDFDENSYLEDIPIIIDRSSPPIHFRKEPGTYIRITKITPWKNDPKLITRLVSRVSSFESPVQPSKPAASDAVKAFRDPGFAVAFTADDRATKKAIDEVKSIKDLLKQAPYRMAGSVDESGIITYNYTFDRADYKDIKRTSIANESNLKSFEAEWFGKNPLTNESFPGAFEISFHAWDLDSAALKTAGLASTYKDQIRPNTGVRIYRDGYRVFPYGEDSDDWLGLDLERLNDPKSRGVSRNQIIGIIHISSIKNGQLRDQSNREGLIVNPQYEAFYHLVRASLNLFAVERKKDKIRIDRVTVKNSSEDGVTQALSGLRKRIALNKHTDLYEREVESVETSYRNRINDILERYMMAAAIGISYTIPIHEMRLRLSSMKAVLEDLREKPDRMNEYLRELVRIVSDTDDVVRAVSSIMSRQKRQKIKLSVVANNARILKANDISKFGVQLDIDLQADLEVDAVPGLLNTAVLNLVDNAIYWVRARKINSRQQNKSYIPTVMIRTYVNENGRAVLMVRDNGEGFEDPLEFLIEPYYSRRSDGLGLGLYLVNEIMVRMGGKLIGYNDQGAVFELIF